ncbi:hypothetical protein [Methanopyrus sp.]
MALALGSRSLFLALGFVTVHFYGIMIAALVAPVATISGLGSRDPCSSALPSTLSCSTRTCDGVPDALPEVPPTTIPYR